MDLLTAAGLAAFVELEILTTDVAGPLAWLVPLGLLATLPVAVRRRLPVVALVLVVAGIVVLDAVSEVQEPQSTLLAYLLVVYSAGAHADRTRGLGGLAIAIAGLTIDEPEGVIVLGPLSVATWPVAGWCGRGDAGPRSWPGWPPNWSASGPRPHGWRWWTSEPGSRATCTTSWGTASA